MQYSQITLQANANTQLNLGSCGICERVIWTTVNNRMVVNSFYSEFWMKLNNSTVAKHAVCSVCLNTLTHAMVASVFKRIQKTWHKEMAGWGKTADFTRMEALRVVSWGKTEATINSNTIEYP